MADLTDLQAAETVKIVGSNSSGLEQTAVNSTSSGGLHINLRDNSGTEIGTTTTPIAAAGNSAAGAADAGNPIKVGGVYNTTLPVYTNGQRTNIQTDASGRILVSSSPLPTSASKFSFGYVTTAATTQAPVQRTVYTEQTTNAQRSIASSNANDTSAGTGARTVIITYLDQTGAGPFTETVTLNGTAFVNTTNTNICFIENIKVATVGSTGSNVGILTLRAATGGGGVVIGTIAATDNQTIWAHHYVPINKTAYISGFSINSSGTTTGSGANFVLKASTPTVANTPEIQISDFHRLYGQQSSTNTRNYLSPIQIAGPSRIRAYVTPETSTSTVYRAAFDFIDN